MLELKNVTKVYGEGANKVEALKGISLKFPENGIVSVLGTSGCGKTTLLNIIGGLDSRTSGDIVIDNVSVENYTAADWNEYRKKNVGFVFQNYYLIPHLSVLENVVAPMKLSGVKRDERKKRAAESLAKVGLLPQMKKRPKQLSGGQAQRAAIARAVVNNPRVILADEPTGALDSETSTQVMDLLKILSKDALVVLVTHNSDIAQKYSDRILKMSDGAIISDVTVSAQEDKIPNIGASAVASAPKKKKRGKNMNFFAAVSTSLKNLYYKKGRTALTAVASCIGIVSIAVILALNSGFSSYALQYQKSSLSKYPITVAKSQSSMSDISDVVSQMQGSNFSTLDTDAIMSILDSDNSPSYYDAEKIYIKKLITGLGDNLDELTKENDTTEFKKYVDANFDGTAASVIYDYDLDLNLYNMRASGTSSHYEQISPFSTRTGNSLTQFNALLSTLGLKLSSKDIANAEASLSNIKFWSAMTDDADVLDSQYKLVSGSWPQDDADNKKFQAVLVVDRYNRITDASLYALGYIEFGDLLGSMLLNSDDIIKELTGADVKLGTIGKELQLEYDPKDFVGHEFKLLLDTDYYSYNETSGLYEYKGDDDDFVSALMPSAATVSISGIVKLRDDVSSGCIDGDIGYTQSLVRYIVDGINSSAPAVAQKAEYENYLALKQTEDYAEFLALQKSLSLGEIKPEDLTQREQLLFAQESGLTIRSVIDGTADMSDESSYETLLLDLGVKDLDSPEKILFYPYSIEDAQKTKQFIEDYNVKAKASYDSGQTEEDDSVEYVNKLDSIMALLKSAINTITYILIAITCLAVVVSLFMVGIISYISVQDRTKEIGILRSMGARKIDIMNIFNAETMILGFLGGILGVALGYAFTPAINGILHQKLGIANLLQPLWWHPIILIGASVILTCLSGLIPAIFAAKKDPVAALRTE